MAGDKKMWGDYYMGKRKDSWALELMGRVNGAIPKFTEIFDEDTFYVTAVVFVLSTFVVAFLISRFITIREHRL